MLFGISWNVHLESSSKHTHIHRDGRQVRYAVHFLSTLICSNYVLASMTGHWSMIFHACSKYCSYELLTIYLIGTAYMVMLKYRLIFTYSFNVATTFSAPYKRIERIQVLHTHDLWETTGHHIDAPDKSLNSIRFLISFDVCWEWTFWSAVPGKITCASKMVKTVYITSNVLFCRMRRASKQHQ